MNFTSNPAVGGNEGDWGTIINAILDELKAAANSLDSGKAAIDHAHSDYATADALASAISTLETALAEKAATDHAHTEYAATDHDHPGLVTAGVLATLAARVTAVEELMDFMNPDITNLLLEATIANRPGGISVVITTNPAIYIRQYNITVKKAGNVVFVGGGSANVQYVSHDWGFADGDPLEVQVQVITGVAATKASEWYNHTYQDQAPQIGINEIVGGVMTHADFDTKLENIVATNDTVVAKAADVVYGMMNPGE